MTTVAELFGVRCPSCSSDEKIFVAASVELQLFPDGSEVVGDCDFTHRSLCSCGQCDFAGLLRDFQIDEVQP